MEHRLQKKQAALRRYQLGKEFSSKWQENYIEKPGAVPLEEQKALPNTNENTGKDAADSGSQVSQELTSSSAPNISDEKYASDLQAEENRHLSNITKDTAKETEGGSQCSQELATSSMPEVPESQAPLEQPTPPNINYNPGRGSQELTSSSAPYVPVAEENLPLPMINKETGKETVVTGSCSQCSQDMSTSSVRQVLPDWVPEMDNIYPSAKERDAGLTFESLYASLLHPDGSPSLLNPNKKHQRLQVFKDIVNEIEYMPVPSTNDHTGRETESNSHGSQELTFSCVSNKTVMDCRTKDNTGRETESSSQGSHELTISSVLNKTVKHFTSPPDITSRTEFLMQPEKNKNTGKEPTESGSQVSQDLTSSSAPTIPIEDYAGDLPAKENLPLPKINKDTGKETEVTEGRSQCSQDLTTSSVPKVLPDRVPQMDSMHPSAKQKEVFLTFGSLYNCSLQQVWSPHHLNPHRSSHGSQELTSSSAVPVEKQASVLPDEENLPLPMINKDTGKETEVTGSCSQCSQDMSTSSVRQVLPDRVPQMDNIHPSAKKQEAGLTLGSLYDSSLHQDRSPHLRNPDCSSHGSQELTISSVPNKTVKHSISPPNFNSKQ